MIDGSPNRNNRKIEHNVNRHLASHCHACGAKCLKNSFHCHVCGTKLTPVKLCNKCKNQCPATDVYCRFCGALIAQEKPPQTYKSLKSLFTESRVALYVAITGLVFVIFQIPGAWNFLRHLVVERSTMFISNFKYVVLFSILLTISAYNLKVPIIPNRVVYPGIAIGLIMSGIGGGNIEAILNSLLGMMVLFVAFYIPWLLKKSPIRAGTVKYSAMIGAFIGLNLSLVMLGFAFVFLLPKYVLDIHVRGREELINTAPYLSISALITIWLL